ncbi:hypothetical protein HDU67_000292, partial [Dinochytrium kinnereticum]
IKVVASQVFETSVSIGTFTFPPASHFHHDLPTLSHLTVKNVEEVTKTVTEVL